MKTSIFTLAFAAITMTASANTQGWRNTRCGGPDPRMGVRHNRHMDWQRCHHNRIDRHGRRAFCLSCGSELVWRGNRRHGHYEAIPPRPMVNNPHGGAPVPPPEVRPHGGAPTPPPPAHGYRR